MVCGLRGLSAREREREREHVQLLIHVLIFRALAAPGSVCPFPGEGGVRVPVSFRTRSMYMYRVACKKAPPPAIRHDERISAGGSAAQF